MKRNYLGLIMGLLFMQSTFAQSEINHSVSLELQKYASIKSDASSTAILHYTFDSPDKLEKGIVQQQADGLQVSSNARWIVQVKAKKSTFSYQGSELDPAMPASVLQIKKSGSVSEYIPLAMDDHYLINGNAGNFSENKFKVDYKVNPGVGYPAGSYEMEVAFTVSNP